MSNQICNIQTNDFDASPSSFNDSHSHSHSHNHNHNHNHNHGHSHGHSHGHGHGGHGHSHENMNIRALFLHVLADALGNVAVIASALMIKYTNFWLTTYIDPITTIIIIILIARVSWPLVRSTMNILLDKSPSNINIDLIYEKLNQLTGVLNVHELHVWEVTPGNLMATVHLIINPQCEVMDAMKILDQVCSNLFEIARNFQLFPSCKDMRKDRKIYFVLCFVYLMFGLKC